MTAASTLRRVGVEEEFLLVRPGRTDLAPEGESVVADASAAAEGAQFEHELKQAQAELGSEPTASLPALERDLVGLRGRLADAAHERGVQLVASGTSPVLAPARTTVQPRYQAMTEEFGLVARQQLTCGMHLHIDVGSDDEGVRVIDGITPWLPVLTALSANSPFYNGNDTGLASYRSVLWGQWPTAGPTGGFGSPAAYRALQQTLVGLGAARDEAMLYFAARLSARYPTVEIRVCDVCAVVEDAPVLAGLARALVEHAAAADPAPPLRLEVLRAAAWRAARDGMDGELVDPVGLGGSAGPLLRPAWDLVERLLDRVAGELDAAGDTAFVTEGLARIRDRGTGARHQRTVYAEHDDFAAVMGALAVRPG